MAGDFNFPSRVVEWILSKDGIFPDIKGGVTDEKVAFQTLQELTTSFSLEQMVDQPTREKAILDLVYTDCPVAFSECSVQNIKPTSDHNLVKFDLGISALKANDTQNNTTPIQEISKYNFRSANHEAMAQALQNTDWDSALGDITDIESANDNFAEAVVTAAKKANVPLYHRKSANPAENQVIALNCERSKLERQNANASITITDKATKLTRIESINSEIQQILTNNQEEQERRIINDIKNNPKAFYKYANSTKESKIMIGPLKSGHTFESGHRQMANILSDQYLSVFSIPRTDLSSLELKEYNIEMLNDIDISEEHMAEAIKDMGSTSAPGPDGIPAFLFKTYTDQLVYPITKIWRISLDTGNLPEGTALAVITPIYKGGTRSLPANYRPVSLTNHLTKLFERVLRKAIVLHLEANDLMNSTQHGFRAGRSTISQLLCYYDDILSKLEEGGEVDAIYLDFSKAFDKVDHNILLLKVANLKIGGKILTWIESFLRRRRQVVKVKNEYSKQEKVVSGVPQGSVLGPLLFIILMIDINDSIIHAALGSYADDTRLWHTIINLLNANELQEELSKIYVWADLNNMTFNNDKFEMMSFTSTNHPTNRNPLYLSPSGETLSKKEVIKHLEIQFDEKLTFHTQQLSQQLPKVSEWQDGLCAHLNQGGGN